MDWGKLPDLIAFGLLAGAFASVSRQSHTPVSRHWLTGWLLIVVHFGAFAFAPMPGWVGTAGNLVGLLALIWAGILFMRAAVPYRTEKSSRTMLLVLLFVYTFYATALTLDAPHWLLGTAAFCFALGPLTVTLISAKRFIHPLRWLAVGMQAGLGVFLLANLNRNDGGDLALNGVLFTVYMGAALHFWYMYRRASAGAFITICGFFLWANVFTVAPITQAIFPNLHLESEVWNLPKYVVAVGMILILLEDQIAHNKHLALHDALTGLPNRRLFQDRLTGALERARRTGTQTALVMLDLDRFKQVNDTLGHHIGDLLLQGVAQRFNGRIRRSDTVSRTGGDEFAVILEGPTSMAEAKLVGQSLLDLLKEPLQLKDRLVKVDASMGVAIFPDDAQDMEQLFIKADLRMYDFKRNASSPVLIDLERRTQTTLSAPESNSVQVS
ncbi:MAG TPA: diguanylate cyclase [Terracidiphilus sp.]|nr:diguanylate cyclase [Terracidiphilus sp.]